MTKLRVYYTYRYLFFWPAFIWPSNSFAYELNTIKWLENHFVAQKADDNRILWCWTYEWDIPADRIKRIVAEALSKFAYRERTPEEAAEYIKEAFWDALEEIKIEDWEVKYKLKPLNQLGPQW